AVLHYQGPWPRPGSIALFDDHKVASGEADSDQQRGWWCRRGVFVAGPAAGGRFCMTDKFTVYLVDDDPGVLKALSRLLQAKGYDVRPYSSPQVFLEEHDVSVPGCVVLDVSMPELDGLSLQRSLGAAAGSDRPIVFITGKGDIPTSVRAMKA